MEDISFNSGLDIFLLSSVWILNIHTAKPPLVSSYTCFRFPVGPLSKVFWADAYRPWNSSKACNMCSFQLLLFRCGTHPNSIFFTSFSKTAAMKCRRLSPGHLWQKQKQRTWPFIQHWQCSSFILSKSLVLNNWSFGRSPNVVVIIDIFFKWGTWVPVWAHFLASQRAVVFQDSNPVRV